LTKESNIQQFNSIKEEKKEKKKFPSTPKTTLKTLFYLSTKLNHERVTRETKMLAFFVSQLLAVFLFYCAPPSPEKLTINVQMGFPLL
jgi:hypothetical protein